MKIAKDVDEYLAAVPTDQRAALERLRKIIRAAAPKAIEGISYGMPGYKYLGALIYFAAFKNHCSFFPASGKLIRDHQRELASYETAKGTIRFTVDKPLPPRPRDEARQGSRGRKRSPRQEETPQEAVARRRICISHISETIAGVSPSADGFSMPGRVH